MRGMNSQTSHPSRLDVLDGEQVNKSWEKNVNFSSWFVQVLHNTSSHQFLDHPKNKMAGLPTSQLILIFLPFVIGQTKTISKVSELPASNRKLFDFFSGGLTELVWDENKIERLKLSEKCTKSLRITKDHNDRGSEWAFRRKFIKLLWKVINSSISVLDASSKSSAGILDGTVTSYGDYDECLSIVPPNVGLQFTPKYCIVELTLNPRFENIGHMNKFINFSTTAIGATKILFGTCSLSLCSDSDISSIINESEFTILISVTNIADILGLRDQPFQFTGSLSCETNDDNTWYNRITKTTIAQRAGMWVLMIGCKIFQSFYVL